VVHASCRLAINQRGNSMPTIFDAYKVTLIRPVGADFHARRLISPAHKTFILLEDGTFILSGIDLESFIKIDRKFHAYRKSGEDFAALLEGMTPAEKMYCYLLKRQIDENIHLIDWRPVEPAEFPEFSPVTLVEGNRPRYRRQQRPNKRYFIRRVGARGPALRTSIPLENFTL
jgi:hypothetical protein